MALGNSQHGRKLNDFSDLRGTTHYEAGPVEINVARHSGYCWGVQRAYDVVLAEAKQSKGKNEPIVTFGPLIHNPQTIDELRHTHGVDYVDNPEQVVNGKVVVRTHGIPLNDYEKFKEKGINVIDATCPYVKVTQNYAALLHKQKYHVVIVGDYKHPEVISILSFARGEGTVVKTVEDVEKIPKHLRRLGVVVQSTMILEHVSHVIAAVLARAQEVRVFNTICYVTSERQGDAEEIARSNDFVVVVGGKASSNTKKLAVVAETYGARTQLIEGPEELDFSKFGDARRIGVLAGASTPNWLIDQVVESIERHYNAASVV